MHLYGQGCPACSGNQKSSTNNFIKQAQLIHKNKYTYQNVKYINSDSKICITCPIHGDFLQVPHRHLRGQGCLKCSGKYSPTSKEFITKANKIHQNFNYSKVEYKNNRSKITIICPNNHAFQQTPANHLKGEGCPKCITSNGEKFIRNYLIENNISFQEQYRLAACKNKLPLPFDFAIINNDKLNGLIEFQGKQHYQLTSFGCKDSTKIQKEFKRIQLTDKIKKDFCITNQILFLEIPYWHINNISLELTKFLEKINSIHQN